MPRFVRDQSCSRSVSTTDTGSGSFFFVLMGRNFTRPPRESSFQFPVFNCDTAGGAAIPALGPFVHDQREDQRFNT